MRRTVSLKVLSLSLSLLVVGMVGCQQTPAPEANRSAMNENANREPVNTASIETELRRIENDWPRVLKEKDVAAVRRVEADDLVIIYPDGTVGSKAQDIEDLEKGNLTADSWEVTDLNVKVLDNDAAVASGRSIVKGGKVKTPDGKTIDISGEYRFADTFARRNGQWQLVASAAVPAKAPMGGAAAKPSPGMSPSPAASPRMQMSPRSSPAATRPSPAATR